MAAISRIRSIDPRQLLLFRHGGARPGAGRKPKAPRALVSHVTRPVLAARFPVLVTARLGAGLPNLRREETLPVLRKAFKAGSDGVGIRLVHYSIQANHLHFLVESSDADALSRGIQVLLVRVARALNRSWGRRGRVFADRHHTRNLRTPREVRHALVYVLNNAHKHGASVAGIDSFSSGRWFDGWIGRTGRPLDEAEARLVPVAEPRTWLLRTGWRRHGLVGVSESPVGAPCNARGSKTSSRSSTQVSTR